MSVNAATPGSAPSWSVSSSVLLLQFRKLPPEWWWSLATRVADSIVARSLPHLHPQTVHAGQLRLRDVVREDSVGHGHLQQHQSSETWLIVVTRYLILESTILRHQFFFHWHTVPHYYNLFWAEASLSLILSSTISETISLLVPGPQSLSDTLIDLFQWRHVGQIIFQENILSKDTKYSTFKVAWSRLYHICHKIYRVLMVKKKNFYLQVAYIWCCELTMLGQTVGTVEDSVSGAGEAYFPLTPSLNIRGCSEDTIIPACQDDDETWQHSWHSNLILKDNC